MPDSLSSSNPTRRPWMKATLLFVGAFVLGGLILPNLHISWREPSTGAQGNGGNLGVLPSEPPKGLSPNEAYATAAQAVYKSVVNIDTTQKVRVAPGMFDDWYMDGPRYRESSSQGSGVIIDRNGYILTNEHVVGAAHDNNKKILVTLSDGRSFPGTVIGADHTTDVALVKIEGPNLVPAKIGTVRGLIPGQMAVALGNPLGFRFTVTHGVVSALGRPIAVSEDRVYENLIQTDCAINPGNSGGALSNIKGEVIGINTIVASRAQGIGFAIPIDTALRVADELKQFGKVKRPWTGLIVETNTPAFVQRYGLPNVAGVVVTQIYRDGPGTTAGLQPGDVITKINGQGVTTQEEFKSFEKKLRIGQRIDIEVQRPDERGRGNLTVGEAP